MKKIILALLLCLLLLVLTGCACKHEETELLNAQEAACEVEGYTGDVVCVKCKEVVEKGAAIPALAHKADLLLGQKEATCTQEGYTGDTVCSVCRLQLAEGQIIPKAAHTHGAAVNVKEADCVNEGYTGDIHCTACNELLSAGEKVPVKAHVPGEAVNVKAPHCEWEGYTGDIYCTVCQQLLSQGEAIPMTPHVEDGVLPGEAATCEKDGREESIMCTRCLLVTKPGKKIPALGHQWTGEDVGLEPTCLKNGYTAEKTCSVCGEWEPRKTIPQLQAHPYDEKGLCTVCGWMEPGLYVNDELVMAWADMEANGYAVVEKGQLIRIEGNMQMGKVVVGEDVTYIDGNYSNKPGIHNNTIKEVWIPRSVTRLGNYLLNKNTSVTDVRMFCQIYELEDAAFRSSLALERVILPDSLEVIGRHAFYHTPALKEVKLPAGLESIGVESFYGSAIEELQLPDGVTMLGLRAFNSSALKEITLPASMERLGGEVFSRCTQLVKIDMSACSKMRDMYYGNFRNCTALTELLLPPNLVLFADGYNQLDGATALRHLAFPEGFKAIGDERFNNTQIESVVWPVSLIDAGGLARCPLKEIYYRGSEAQWMMTTASTLFPEAKITFNYTGD